MLRPLVLCAAVAGHAAWADVPRFEPVEVTAHVYDGGWEHFVGGGLAVLDCNDDGRPDLVAAGGANPPVLLRNTSPDGGGVTFETSLPDALDVSGTVGA